MISLLDTALTYHRAGLTVLPNDPAAKFPAGLRGWQSVQPSEQDVRRWFTNGHHAIGIRDVEGLDFDNKGAPDAAQLLREWTDLCEQLAPGLAGRLLLEKTPSGGYHLAWRCEAIQGNQKLATRPPTPEELQTSPKLTSVTLIETRGKGGQFQVSPSPGYALLRGDWAALPEITPAERAIILDCARAMTRTDRRTIDLVQRSTGERPGDIYNRDHADAALKLLEQAGWVVMRERDGALYLCRPGKDHGISATFGFVAPGVLYVFSSNAAPFDSGRAYSPFAIYTEMLHNGDYRSAAAALRGETVEPRPRVNVETGEIGGDESGPRYTTVPTMPIDVNDLLALERKAVIWYAPGFLREGLGVLIGQPNVGKTPLLIQLAIALATGGKWMNAVPCLRSKVLFLGVEYTRQEIIPLVDISRCGVDIPRGQLLIKTMEDDFPTTAEDALAELEWYIRVLGVEVIIIDVMTAFLPPEKFKQNVYRGDYAELKPYHKLASLYNAAILGSWHASKREADPKLMYNGSTGMWAVPASRITLYQDLEQRVRIASYPRMADKTEWALTQERTLTGRRWIAADIAPEPVCSPTELQIFRFLKENTDKANPRSSATIAEMTGLPAGSTRTMLARMFDKNLIQRVGSVGGYYVESVVTDVASVTDVAGVTPVTPVTPVTDGMIMTTGHNEEEDISVTTVTRRNTVVLPRIEALESDKSDPVTSVTRFSRNSAPLAPEDTFLQLSTPIDAIPRTLHMTTRMMLVSDVERNIEAAQARCAEYGVDYEVARAWAIQYAKEH